MAITEFQNGFITKSKLNELVDGINALDIVVLTENITKTVGSGGDFATLGLALDWCKKILPNGFNVNLNILSGHLIKEQIILENCDFRFLQIDSVDDTVYMNNASVTTRPSFIEQYNYYPAIALYKTNMGKINTKLRLDGTANPENVLNMYMRDSQVEFMKGKGTYSPPYLWKNSELIATEYESSAELYILNNSKASFYGIRLNGAYAGIKASYGSKVNLFRSPDYLYNSIIKSTSTSNLSMIRIGEGSLLTSELIVLDYAGSDNNYSPLEVDCSEVILSAWALSSSIISPNCAWSIQVKNGGTVRGKSITKTKPYNVTPYTWGKNGYVGV